MVERIEITGMEDSELSERYHSALAEARLTRGGSPSGGNRLLLQKAISRIIRPLERGP